VAGGSTGGSTGGGGASGTKRKKREKGKGKGGVGIGWLLKRLYKSGEQKKKGQDVVVQGGGCRVVVVMATGEGVG